MAFSGRKTKSFISEKGRKFYLWFVHYFSLSDRWLITGTVTLLFFLNKFQASLAAELWHFRVLVIEQQRKKT
jgi:hypothetical protein